ncbi:MAG: hypothetical protein HYS61_09335 [Acidobacteria bacterium]|nr:hypothetical protein [Acidobacteriota bacterium]
MEIIDRYIYEVGNRLPRKSRGDVQVELHTLLHETLEERSRDAGRPADEELAAQVLREFGSPREVAGRYAPRARYLIGPRWYSLYMLIVKIVTIVLASVFAAFVIVALVFSKGPLAAMSVGKVAKMLWAFVSAGIFNLAILTLVFAIVERTQLQPDQEVESWDPGMLPPVDDPDRISPGGIVFGMYMILAFAVLLNLYPQWMVAGFRFQGDQAAWGLSLLLPAFVIHLPFINAFLALEFFLKLTVLRHGRWGRETRWAEFAMGLFGAAITYRIIIGPEVFRFDWIVKSLLKGVLIIVLIDSGARLYRLLTRRRVEPMAASEAPASRE